MSLLEDWKGGFTLQFDRNPMFDEEWLLDDRYSTEASLYFIGYDANLYPLPDLSKLPAKHRQEVVNKAKHRLRDVNATIYLDDVKIQDGDGE
jgi:hypothetical protein